MAKFQGGDEGGLQVVADIQKDEGQAVPVALKAQVWTSEVYE